MRLVVGYLLTPWILALLVVLVCGKIYAKEEAVKIVTTPIPEGSFSILVWHSLDDSSGEIPSDKRPYDFCCNLNRIDAETCEVARAMGNLTNEVSIAIGRQAIALGFRRLTFFRSAGGPATHWAKFIETRDGLDYYEVDLIAAQALFKSGEINGH